MRFFHSIGILLGVMMCCVSASSSPIPLTSFTHDSDQSSNPKDFFEWQGAWYFSAISNTHGRELWTAELNGENARMLCDIAAGTLDSSPRDFIEHKGELWFVADDHSGYTLLCKVNSQGECTVIKRVEPINQFSHGKVQIDALRSTPDRLYFTLAGTVHSSSELWGTTSEPGQTQWIDSSINTQSLTTIGRKIVYRGSKTWIYDPNNNTKKIYYDGYLYLHQIIQDDKEQAPITLRYINSNKFAIMSLPLDGSAPVTLQTYELPQQHSPYDFTLLSRIGNHCLARFSYTGPYPQYQAFAGLARFDLSSNQVELFNIKLDDNDDVGWELFSISPSGEIYCKDYYQAPLMLFGATGALQVVHTFANQGIQGIYAAKDNVFVMTEGARSTTNPATKPWQIHQITEPNSNPQATVIQQGTVLADNRFPLSFDANVAASQDGQHIAFSQPIDGYGMEAGFLSANGAVQSINLNTRGFQKIGSLHTQNDGTTWFSLTKEDGSSQLWQTNTQANDAREPVLEGDVAGSTLDSFHPLKNGLLIFKRHGNLLSCWYYNDKSMRRVSIASYGWHIASSYNAKVLFNKNDQALVQLDLGVTKPGLWIFDSLAARMNSLDDHLKLPEESSMTWSHQTNNFAFFDIEEPSANGIDRITSHWKCDGTITGTKTIPRLADSIKGSNKWSIYIADGAIKATDHLTDKTVVLRKSVESINLADYVVRESIDLGRHFYFDIATTTLGPVLIFPNVFKSDGSTKGTTAEYFGYIAPKECYSQRWTCYRNNSLILNHQFDKRAIGTNGFDPLFQDPRQSNITKACGHTFLKIHQVLADDVAIYFVATTREHGDAIFVTYGTEKTTFLLQSLTTSNPESTLLKCTAEHLYYHQLDQMGADQVYAMPLVKRRVVTSDFVAHEEGQDVTFTETNQEHVLQIVRPQSDLGKKITYRITGDDANVFRIGKLLDFPSRTNALYQEISLHFTSTSFLSKHVQIEFYVDGENTPFALIPLIAKRAAPPCAITINGTEHRSTVYAEDISDAWGWNFALKPSKDVRNVIERIDYIHNGNVVFSGSSLSHIFQPGPDYENNLRAIGYDSFGNVVLDELFTIYQQKDERIIQHGNYAYYGAFSLSSYDVWRTGEIQINESTDGSFSIKVYHEKGVKRGRGKFDNKGLASVKVRSGSKSLSLGLAKNLDHNGIPYIDCIVTDGNFNNGTISGQIYYFKTRLYANNRAETGHFLERPGRYHALLEHYESSQAVATLNLDRDGTVRIMGTWLDGKRFTRVTGIPRINEQTIYLENQYPLSEVTIRLEIPETQDHFSSISASIVQKSTDQTNIFTVQGFVDRYDQQQDGNAWSASQAPPELSLALGPFKKSPIQSTLLQRNESSVTWAEYTNGGSTKVKIDTASGSAQVSGKGFSGEALYFPSRGKFFGTVTSGKPGQVITVELP